MTIFKAEHEFLLWRFRAHRNQRLKWTPDEDAEEEDEHHPALASMVAHE
jgi:hypothetical protein